MKYLICILIPLLLQVGCVYIIGVRTEGTGSWAGLGAFLFAIPVVPLTAVINAVRTRRYYQKKTLNLFLQSLTVAVVTPAVIIGLFAVAALMEGLVDHFL